MNSLVVRIQQASRPALWHLLGSILVAANIAAFVFWFWFPHPYQELAGGRNLFWLIVAVDVACGPLLTLVLFQPEKSRRELVFDMSLVISIQIAALIYGISTVYVARPLFLVHEVDRFRVIALPDLREGTMDALRRSINPSLKPTWLSGPIAVGIREPKTEQERLEVMADAISGGADYSQRPEFYIPYDTAYQRKVLEKAKPLLEFIQQNPGASHSASEILEKQQNLSPAEALYLPVVFKKEWVAVLDKSARILGFIPGDGFGQSSE